MKTDPTLYRDASHYDHAFARETAYAYHLGPPEESPTFPVWEAVLDLLGDPEEAGRILEIGCGCGQFAKLALDRGFNYIVGSDFSAEGVARAREQCGRGPLFLIRDVEEEGFGVFDVVGPFQALVLVEVLEHLRDDLAVLRAIPPGKHIVFSVPSFLTVGHVRAFDLGLEDVVARYGDLLDFGGYENHRVIERGSNSWVVVAATRRNA